jgi:hypothetical protein
VLTLNDAQQGVNWPTVSGRGHPSSGQCASEAAKRSGALAIRWAWRWSCCRQAIRSWITTEDRFPRTTLARQSGMVRSSSGGRTWTAWYETVCARRPSSRLVQPPTIVWILVQRTPARLLQIPSARTCWARGTHDAPEEREARTRESFEIAFRVIQPDPSVLDIGFPIMLNHAVREVLSCLGYESSERATQTRNSGLAPRTGLARPRGYLRLLCRYGVT